MRISRTFVVYVALLTISLGFPLAAQSKCKFEIDDQEVLETKMFVIARGFNTGLSGHIGRSAQRFYLRGHYYSQFAGTPGFDSTTPLEFTLSDGSTLSLPVLEGALGKLDVTSILANNREAVPVFALTPEQLTTIEQGTVAGVRVNRIDKGVLGVKEYKVSKRTARKLAEAARCVIEKSSAP